MNITRTLTLYKVQSGTLDMCDGKPLYIAFGDVEIAAPRMTRTIARAALKAAGVPVPKGCYIEWHEEGSKVYAMSLEKFVENAEVVG